MLLFTAGYGQVEGTLLLWAQDSADRVLLGFEIPAAWFVGFPAAMVLLLAPAQLAFLPRLQRRIGPPRLAACGLIAMALAFSVLIPVAIRSAPHQGSIAFLIGCLTLLVVAELLIVPTGAAEILRLAPPRFVGAVAGVFSASSAIGCWLAGEMGALWVEWSPPGSLAILVTLPLLGSALVWGHGPRIQATPPAS